eukprot:TRINITY_DN8964_c0_g1_i1.p1 TRINITY_DN8964_c0_g1~~TRINITY_DN8964_c0_g1_i1.p1  ORF type:complete len:301 (-),score=36.14 TRINITY_DN8964_c0_g1_i1:44-946(-)
MIEGVEQLKPSRATLLLVLSMFDQVIQAEEDEDVQVVTPEEAIENFKLKLANHSQKRHRKIDVNATVPELCLKRPTNQQYRHYFEQSQGQFKVKFASLTADILKSTVSAALVHLQDAVRTVSFAFSNPQAVVEQLRLDRLEASQGFSEWKTWIMEDFYKNALTHAREAAADPAVKARLDAFSDPEAIAHEFHEQILTRCKPELSQFNQGLTDLGKRLSTTGPRASQLLQDVGERWFQLSDHATRAFFAMNPIHFFWRDTSKYKKEEREGGGEAEKEENNNPSRKDSRGTVGLTGLTHATR